MFLVDTNIIIYYLEGSKEAVDFLSAKRAALAISSITWMEVLSYSFTPQQEVVVRQFLNEFRLLEISKPVMEQAVNLRRQKSIKLPDAIIAASSIYYEMPLVTRNTKDFRQVPIQLIDPFHV